MLINGSAGPASLLATLLAILPPAFGASLPYSAADFSQLRKFDAHVHVNTTDPAFLTEARADNFELLSINVDYPDFPSLAEQAAVAKALLAQHPERFHYATTFAMRGWTQPGWAESVKAFTQSDVF